MKLKGPQRHRKRTGKSLVRPVLLVFFAAAAFFLTHSVPVSKARASAGNYAGTLDSEGVARLIRAKGPPTVIVMMASWCGPCRGELPTLNKLYEKYRPRGLRMFGLSFEIGGPSTLQPILDRFHVRFPVYCVPEEILSEYGITAIPLLFLIRNGKVMERIKGSHEEAFLENKIHELLR